MLYFVSHHVSLKGKYINLEKYYIDFQEGPFEQKSLDILKYTNSNNICQFVAGEVYFCIKKTFKNALNEIIFRYFGAKKL